MHELGKQQRAYDKALRFARGLGMDHTYLKPRIQLKRERWWKRKRYVLTGWFVLDETNTTALRLFDI